MTFLPFPFHLNMELFWLMEIYFITEWQKQIHYCQIIQAKGRCVLVMTE